MAGPSVRVVLFDLGGVLFQLAGIRAFGDMIGEPNETEVLRLWVINPWVQRYDRGACSSIEFAAGMVAHYRIEMDATEFLARFKTWVPGPHDGALELVRATKASGITIACLSNTNEAHWNADNGLAEFSEQFDHSFLSFEALLQPAAQIGPGPGANPVALRLRPGDDDRRQRRFLVCRQPPRRVALWTVVKPLQSLCIVTNNRVAKRLAIHPRKPRGISPGHLLGKAFAIP